jgi:hypothetical protein
MRAKDIFLAVFVFVIFILLFFVNVLLSSMDNMQRNWAVNRCNPMFMPFAGYFGQDPVENFTYCIQNMQSSYMTYLLQPVTYSIGLMGDVAGGLMNDLNSMRTKVSSLVKNISGIVGAVLGVFVNIIIQMQRILIKLKDTFMKLVGTLILLAYSMEGAISTGESIMAGPIGGALMFLCFHPDTPIKVYRNDGIKSEVMTVPIKNTILGDVIFNDETHSRVTKLYSFKNKDCRENAIYSIENTLVTAHHKVYYNGKWIYVKDHPDAVLTNEKTDLLYCFETDNGMIPIGSHIFHDWEDDDV